MSDIVIRSNEGCDAEPYLLWDSDWSPAQGLADFALAGADEPLNRGGLRSQAGLATAVTLCLFTDRRIEPTHPLYWLADDDPRGWWGDGVDVRDDLGEAAIGSHLWLLARAPLTVNGQPVSRWAEQFALEALAPLEAQRACVRIEAEGVVDELRNRLDLTVRLYGRDGQAIYAQRFELLWNQVTG